MCASHGPEFTNLLYVRGSADETSGDKVEVLDEVLEAVIVLFRGGSSVLAAALLLN
jgi:hypothetical protein